MGVQLGLHEMVFKQCVLCENAGYNSCRKQLWWSFCRLEFSKRGFVALRRSHLNDLLRSCVYMVT